MITCPVKCGMKLLIHSQTCAVEVWEWISNFIAHFILDIIIIIQFIVYRLPIQMCIKAKYTGVILN